MKLLLSFHLLSQIFKYLFGVGIDINDDLLEIILAVDYANLVPYLYPTNVDYFLRETHKSFVVGKEEKIKILDLLANIEENKESFQEVFGSYTKEPGRISFFSFLKGFINGEYNISQFKSETGVNSETEINKSEFALWIFHDSQAQKIVSTK